MKKYDVVYMLKPDFINNELRYSLRSLENFPHADVWFVGGQPNELQPDKRLITSQFGETKWEKVRGMLAKVCINEDVSDDFWLFNDDFFILKPWKLGEAVYNGTLAEHIAHIESRHNDRASTYTKQLRECEKELKQSRLGTLNYAVHCPMLMNKEKLLETLRAFPDCPMFRSLYGNMWEIGGTQHKDCKIISRDVGLPEGADFVSTEDEAFDWGAVGTHLRGWFPDKCEYEL